MSEILSTKTGGVLAIQFAREAKKNALTLDMYQQLTALLNQAAEDDGISVVSITGSDQCFSAGNDLADFLTAGPLDETHAVVQFLFTIRAFPKPIIAGVAGHAVGIGTTMLLHCDLVYADPTAQFQLPFTLLGLCPEAGASLLLGQMMGHAKASELLLFGEPFSADFADKVGIVTGLIDSEESVVEFVAQRAAKLSQLPKESLYASKNLMKDAARKALYQVMQQELEEFDKLLHSETCQQRVKAMLG